MQSLVQQWQKDNCVKNMEMEELTEKYNSNIKRIDELEEEKKEYSHFMDNVLECSDRYINDYVRFLDEKNHLNAGIVELISDAIAIYKAERSKKIEKYEDTMNDYNNRINRIYEENEEISYQLKQENEGNENE